MFDHVRGRTGYPRNVSNDGRRSVTRVTSPAVARVRRAFSRKTIKQDASAGVVLGIESIPDGLANGILAGVNPMAGLYAYMYGMAGGVFFTGSAFMAVGVTGAMALVVADTNLSGYADPTRALFTLSIVTGVVMVLAGVFKLGRLIRFVPTAVMTGFVAAVGVNIVLGQLANLTGFESQASNRVLVALDLVTHPGEIDVWTAVVGVGTFLLISVLTKTRLGALGMVLAVVVGTVAALLLGSLVNATIASVSDIAEISGGLPWLVLPDLAAIPSLVVPALSLAFVGLIQGAAVTAAVANPADGPASVSRDFVGQGVGNMASGLFQGMPVGGSMSGSTLLSTAGAKTRTAIAIAAVTMALVVLLLADVVGAVAMPALAALLITVGLSAIKPGAIRSVLKTGPFQATLMAVTFGLTLIIPLHFAVLVGVSLGIILFVAEASNKLVVRQLVIGEDGDMREDDPPRDLLGRAVVILQPYGSLFFASAPTLEEQLPRVSKASTGAVVILRLRGVDQMGLSLIGVIARYARKLAANGASLKIVASSPQVLIQFEHEGLTDLVGAANVYRGNEWLGRTVRVAYADAQKATTTTKGDD